MRGYSPPQGDVSGEGLAGLDRENDLLGLPCLPLVVEIDATDVASRLHGPARVDLLQNALTSFDVAARWGLAVCMVAVLLSAASAAIGLSGMTPAKR
jgi:hypothetical protein